MTPSPNPAAPTQRAAALTEPRLIQARFADYFELTKPRLSFLSVLTTIAGFHCALPDDTAGAAYLSPLFLLLLVGTALCAGGVAALNQWMEADTDARMRRTADRPIPSGRVQPGSAFVLGWTMCLVGLALLFAGVNGLAAFFALATIVSYLALYTPAKRYTRLSTEIGAVAGALPPLIGWAAGGAGTNPILGLVLFGILFLWQIPHFNAIAWTYRRDYENAAFPMRAVLDPSGNRLALWSLICAILLVVVCLLPSLLQNAGFFYFGFSAILGSWFVVRAAQFIRSETRETTSRKLFFASIIWLPLQLAALALAYS